MIYTRPVTPVEAGNNSRSQELKQPLHDSKKDSSIFGQLFLEAVKDLDEAEKEDR